MVKVIVAAASSGLAREVIDQIVARGKHEIIGLVRRDPATFPSLPGVTWVKTLYQDKAELVEIFKGADVVLSFMAFITEEQREGQKLVLDATIEAGVRRFAPSEWAMGKNLEAAVVDYPWYAGKLEMREILRKLNEKEKVIEYCLFQPGAFLEYFSFPHKTTKHIDPIPFMVNIDACRVIAIEDHLDDELCFTSVTDIGGVVARAIEYEGEWPVWGGIAGNRMSIAQLVKLGEEVQGKPFRQDLLKKEDLEAGVLKLDDVPLINHPSIPKDQVEMFTQIATRGTLLSINKGGWTVPPTWNELLPDYKFTKFEDFVKGLWGNKDQ